MNQEEQMYYSGQNQDSFLHQNYFLNQEKGFYLEIGAMDGQHNSNCKFFEDIGWKGAMVEANPLQYDNIKANRNAPVIIGAIIGNHEEGTWTPFTWFRPNTWGQGLCGIPEKRDIRMTARIQDEIDEGYIDHWQPIIAVPTVKTFEVFNHLDTNEIDILSLDIEGGEMDIMQSIDFEEYYIKTICVENNYEAHDFKGFLKEKGFYFVEKLGDDEIFINERFVPNPEENAGNT